MYEIKYSDFNNRPNERAFADDQQMLIRKLLPFTKN